MQSKFLVPLLIQTLAGLILSVGSALAQETASYRDWDQAAEQARTQKLPVAIVFVANHCGYCERLQETFLAPLQEDGKLQNRALIHAIDTKAGGKVNDFDGERVRAAYFVRRYEVFATPTIVIVDHQGEPLVEPLVGFNGAEQYGDLFDAALADALALLRAPQTPAEAIARSR